jgi:predicted membrane metal-binding protein
MTDDSNDWRDAGLLMILFSIFFFVAAFIRIIVWELAIAGLVLLGTGLFIVVRDWRKRKGTEVRERTD